MHDGDTKRRGAKRIRIANIVEPVLPVSLRRPVRRRSYSWCVAMGNRAKNALSALLSRGMVDA